jgi:hypothetical protein
MSLTFSEPVFLPPTSVKPGFLLEFPAWKVWTSGKVVMAFTHSFTHSVEHPAR